MEFSIKTAEFVTSAGLTLELPQPAGAEIAVVGKSNVGKSSLINSLTGRNKLAKTSATPGKTRLINYFLLNGEFYLVDLPGYGYAKAPKDDQKKWGELMERYLSSGRVSHLFMLIDIRHDPTELDRQMFGYMLYYGIPYTLIATKADKLAKSKRKQAANALAKKLGAPPYAIAYSSETGDGRAELLERIGAVVHPDAEISGTAAE
ncbi:MAG: ribosome biogenesis GTP-binding protein YihA/YsxC [Clostridiales bacterium]|nr:ribosome biogenesis GTP-binding protein YihA/YsxC [Clostridiales bacterium]